MSLLTIASARLSSSRVRGTGIWSSPRRSFRSSIWKAATRQAYAQ